MTAATTNPALDSAEEELLGLLRRAEQGDKEALPALRAVLDRAGGLWRAYADLGAQLGESLISVAAGDNLLLQESLRRALDEKKRELACGAASPLEVLLAEGVALAWLECRYLDLLAAQPSGLAAGRRAELDGRRGRALARQLQAAKALAQVTKLLGTAKSAGRGK